MIGVTASVRSGVSRVPVCGARRAGVSDRLSAPSLDARRLGLGTRGAVGGNVAI